MGGCHSARCRHWHTLSDSCLFRAVPHCLLFHKETLEVTAKEQAEWGQGRVSQPTLPTPAVCFLTTCVKLTGHHPGVTTCTGCLFRIRCRFRYVGTFRTTWFLPQITAPLPPYSPWSVAVSISRRRCAGSRTPYLLVLLPAGCSTAYTSHVAPSYQLAAVAWKPLIFVGDVEFPPFCAPILILQRRVRALPRGRCDNLLIIT